jgi:hypothetical protein
VGIKELFYKYKNGVTDGNPELFWPLMGWSWAIIAFVLGMAHLGVNFLKYKGIL